ncbi:MAG: hypothetical protein ACJAS4_001001 [Bacteriovoracaceae bacterium]|jgi:hypothetical protein
MLKKLLNKTYKTTSLMIIYQLIAMPIGFSADGGKDEYKWNKVGQGAQFLATAINAGVMGMKESNQQPQNNYSIYKQQLQQSLQLTPVDPAQVPPVFSGCLVLPARGNQLTSGTMCSQKNPQEIQAGYAAAMIETAEFNYNQLENFTTKGNERFTAQGVGCYEKKLEDFNGMLLAREEELNKYRENLKKMLDSFNLASKQDLEGIKQASSLLDGGSSPESEKFLKDFKFENIFLGTSDPNNVCGSFIDSEAFRSDGQKGGLRGIEENLFKTMNSPGKGSMSATEVLTKSSQISKEIDTFAEKMSSHMRNRNADNVSVNDISFNGSILSKSNKTLQKVIGNFNADVKNKIGDLENSTKLNNVLTGSGLDKIKTQVLSNGLNADELDKALANYELNEKNSCLTKTFASSGFGAASSFVKRFKNPNISKGLSDDADNPMANAVEAILSDSDMDIDQKLNLIKKEQSKGGNSKYIMTTGKTFSFNGKTIYASTPLRPSQLVEIFVQSCNSSFESENKSNGNGYSKQNAIDTLKNYALQREQIKKVASADIATQIKNEMKSCPSDSTTGTAAMSCSGALNLDSSNFCVRTAQTCASNMKGCYDKAQAQISKVKSDQQALTAKYNANVQGFKASLKQELTALNGFLENQARSLDAQLSIGTVFQIPGLEFNAAEEFFQGQKQGIDESLALEDPAKYLEKVTNDITNLEKGLAKQRLEFVGSNGQGGKLGKMKNDYISSYKTGKKDWKAIIADCQKAMSAVQKNLQEQQKSTSENNELIAEACGELQAFNNDPSKSEVNELASSLAKAVQLQAGSPMGQQFSAQDKAAIADIRSFSSSCGGDVGDDSNPYIGTGGKSGKLTIAGFCGDKTAKETFGKSAESLCIKFKNNSDGCSEDTYEKEANNLNLCSAGNEIVQLPESQNCSGEDNQIDVLKKKDYILKTYGDKVCTPTSQVSENTERDLKYMVQAYNCNKESQRSGEIGVSVCNANMGGSDVNGKGIYNQMARDIGSAIGSSRAMSN